MQIKRKDPLAFDYKLEENLCEEQEWQEIISWYLNQEEKNISLLKQALTDKDFNEIINLADQIYGHGASFGFDKISMFGKKIEVAAVMKDIVLLSCLVSSFESYVSYLVRTCSAQSSPKTNY